MKRPGITAGKWGVKAYRTASTIPTPVLSGSGIRVPTQCGSQQLSTPRYAWKCLITTLQERRDVNNRLLSALSIFYILSILL